jgi:predicted transposase/invertase (TIGR01784 family)
MIRLLSFSVQSYLFPLTRKTKRPTKNKRLHLDEIAKFLFSRSEPLVISFINAGFGMNYDPATVSLRLTTNEYIRNFVASRADIVLVATDKETQRDLFHIEVQTVNDREMSIRMLKYGYNIGLAHQEESDADGRRVLKFPHQMVIFLNDDPGIPDTVEVRVIFPDGQEVVYCVPTLKIRNFSMTDLIDRELYLLLPFEIFKVRKLFEAANRARTDKVGKKDQATDELLHTAEELMQEVERLCNEGRLDTPGKDAIITSMGEIYYHMSTKYSLAREINTKVDTMVTSIMEKVRKEGKLEGKREGEKMGEKKGRLKAYKEIAIRLLEQGYDIAAISNITGLSKLEIESLRNGC